MSSTDLAFALRLFCGGLAQGLTDEEAISHAAFWADHSESAFRAVLADHYPAGFDAERRHSQQIFSSANTLREEVYRLIDNYVSANGLSQAGKLEIISGVSAIYFDGRSGGAAEDHMYDRLAFHQVRERVGDATIGRGYPMTIKPSFRSA